MDRYHGTRTVGPTKKETQQDAERYWRHIPDAEVKRVSDQVPNCSLLFTSEQLKRILAQNRSANRICNRWPECRDGRAVNLIRCEKCGLTFWCSTTCQTQDAKKHATWCMTTTGVDDGPLKTTLMEMKQ